jgi:hypothetical protein
MIVFSLLFIVEQRQLVEPHVQHLFQLFIVDFILANDLSQSRNNIVLAMAINLGLFATLGDL